MRTRSSRHLIDCQLWIAKVWSAKNPTGINWTIRALWSMLVQGQTAWRHLCWIVGRWERLLTWPMAVRVRRSGLGKAMNWPRSSSPKVGSSKWGSAHRLLSWISDEAWTRRHRRVRTKLDSASSLTTQRAYKYKYINSWLVVAMILRILLMKYLFYLFHLIASFF